jgi:tetratricopeptide (TPR) repeat protein
MTDILGSEGFLGGDAETREAGAPDRASRASAGEASAVAIAMQQASADSETQADAAAFLRSQKALADLQVRYFDDERELSDRERQLAIRAALRKQFADRLRNIWQSMATAAAILAAALAAAMVYDAATSRSVVVDSFRAPPSLAARGVNGEVVASGVLDQLQRLRLATRSTTRALDARSAWSGDVKIEIPETGASIGEIDRILHERLSHDLHIGGDLVQTDGGGLALTVRGEDIPAKTFSGGAGDLDKLAQQAAEYVYGRSQPIPFAAYLTENNRNQEALDFLPGAVARAKDDDARARLESDWGIAYAGLNRTNEAIAKYRFAMALKPYYWLAWVNLATTLAVSVGEEAGWRESQAFLSAADKAPADQKPEMRLYINPAGNVSDLPLELAAYQQDAAGSGGAGTTLILNSPAIADVYGLMHDPADAARYLARSDPDDSITKAEANLLVGYEALDRGDANAAEAALGAFWKAWLADPNLQFTFTDQPCLYGLALGLAGKAAESDAVFQRVGPRSLCDAARGDVLERRGDLAGAEAVWARGLQQAPDLYSVYLHRGLSETRRGDWKAAETDLRTAHAKAPHLADPLKAWGDLLARQGRWSEAKAKYDEALKYAPAWADLRRARDRAAREAS